MTIVPCPRCGRPRPIQDRYPYLVRDAAKRQCYPCGIATRNVATYAALDEVAVLRLIDGRPPAHTTPAERRAAVAYLTAHGRSAAWIAERIGVTERSVCRLRAANRAAA